MDGARALLLAAALMCVGAAASDPGERLADSVKEQRARSLFSQIRCLICQNESIDDSEAPLADDLRRIVRQQIVAGHSDADIRAYLVHRFGEFVLLKPKFSPANAILWLTPFVIVGVGGAMLVFRRSTRTEEPPLSHAEQARLDELTVSALVPPQAGLNDGPKA